VSEMTAQVMQVDSRRRIARDEVWELAAAEYRRMLELLRTLGAATGRVPPSGRTWKGQGRGQKTTRDPRIFVCRETGFEPATWTLGRLHSRAELEMAQNAPKRLTHPVLLLRSTIDKSVRRHSMAAAETPMEHFSQRYRVLQKREPWRSRHPGEARPDLGWGRPAGSGRRNRSAPP
jgi:hypothetical protein